MVLSKELSLEELQNIPGCNNVRARHIFALLNAEILKLDWFLQFKGVLSGTLKYIFYIFVLFVFLALTRKRLALRIEDDILYRSKLYSL